MALPTVTFNAATGSDTQASGAGPATALFGTGAALAASTTVTLLVDNPDLSGVAIDGSAVIWVAASSGRQFAKITNKDDVLKTITVELAFTPTEGSKTWGIGGKRKLLETASNRTLFGASGIQPGWNVTLEDDQEITTALIITKVGTNVLPITFKSNTFGTRRTISCSTSGEDVIQTNSNGDYWVYKDLALIGIDDGNNNCLDYISGNMTQVRVINCSFEGASIGIKGAAGSLLVFGCSFTSISLKGIKIESTGQYHIEACYFNAMETAGISLSSVGSYFIKDCIFDSIDNSGAADGAITPIGTSAALGIITGNTFYNCSRAIAVFTAASSLGLIAYNNIIYGSTIAGIVLHASARIPSYIDYNIFFGNLATYTNLPSEYGFGANDTTLIDPEFTNAAGGDFSIGEGLRQLAYPVAATPIYIGGNSSGTLSYGDPGAAQRDESSAPVVNTISASMLDMDTPATIIADETTTGNGDTFVKPGIANRISLQLIISNGGTFDAELQISADGTTFSTAYAYDEDDEFDDKPMAFSFFRIHITSISGILTVKAVCYRGKLL